MARVLMEFKLDSENMIWSLSEVSGRQALLICNHISDGIDLDLFVFALVHKFRLGSSTKASFSLGNNFPIIILTDDFCAWLSICYP